MRYLSIGSVLAILILAGGGCTQSLANQAVERVVENKIESESGQSVDVDFGEDSVSFSDDESGASGTFGTDVKLGDDFPSDIPLPNDISVTGVANSPDGVWVSYTTNQSGADLQAWYEFELKADDWSLQGSFINDSAGNSGTALYEKDGVSIGVITTDSDGTTTVMVTRSED